MGVRRLFSKGRAKFPGGGAKTYYLPTKCSKTYFIKVEKHTILAGQGAGGGKCPLLPSPDSLRTPMHNIVIKRYYLLQNIVVTFQNHLK